MALSAGSRLGPYVVHSLLGSGGMGEVYRAFDERLRREVALKLIAKRLTTESDAVDRFIREALAVSALNHPNIVTIHETGEADEGRYIAMEFVQGRSLRECMRQGLTLERAVDVARQLEAAATVSLATAQHMFEPELHRLRGELLLDADRLHGESARDAFEQALTEARRQGAGLLELRAAHSLAAWLAGEGRAAEARAVLEPVVAGVSEGLNTLDVVEATALLASLQAMSGAY